MGLTIHYRGHLRNPHDVELLLNDVAGKCKDLGWHHMPIHRSNIMPIQGMMVTPPGSEPVWLTFSAKGHLYDPSHFIYAKHPELERIRAHKRRWIHTKTQYAGVETYVAIIHFFRYLQKTYFENFELQDDSQYWETGELYVCLIRYDEFEAIRAKVDGLLDFLGDMKTEYDEHFTSGEIDPFGPRNVTIWRKGWIELNMN